MSGNSETSGGRFLLLHPADNTATALADLAEGEIVDLAKAGREGEAFALRQAVPYAHKFAAASIAKGEAVVKYGEIIGEATRDIRPGEHVHVHNVVGRRARGGE